MGKGTRAALRYGWPVFIVLLLVVWVLNASRVGSRPQGCPQGCSTAAPGNDNRLRVMSLNVLHRSSQLEGLESRFSNILFRGAL